MLSNDARQPWPLCWNAGANWLLQFASGQAGLKLQKTERIPRPDDLHLCSNADEGGREKTGAVYWTCAPCMRKLVKAGGSCAVRMVRAAVTEPGKIGNPTENRVRRVAGLRARSRPQTADGGAIVPTTNNGSRRAEDAGSDSVDGNVPRSAMWQSDFRKQPRDRRPQPLDCRGRVRLPPVYHGFYSPILFPHRHSHQSAHTRASPAK